MRPTFSGFNTVVKGVYASQISLDTVGHNIVNQATTGYSRQRVSLSTTRPVDVSTFSGTAQLGTGVQITNIERVRNPFVDQQIWRENASLGLSTTMVEMLGRIEAMFPEPSETALKSSVDAFWKAAQSLGANAADPAARSTFRQSGVKLVESMQEAGRQLNSMAADINEILTTKVTKVNEISKKIVALNKQISNFESVQNMPANDLRDQRDTLVDEISSLARVTVQEDLEHNYVVQLDGVVLANGSAYTELQTTVDYDTDLYKKYNMKTLGIETNDKPPITLNITTGEIGALFQSRDSDTSGVKGYRDMLDTIAQSFLCDFNQVHREGYGLDNSTGTNFFGRDGIQYSDLTSIGKDPTVTATANVNAPTLNFKSYNKLNASTISLDVAAINTATPPRATSFTFTMNGGAAVTVDANNKDLTLSYDELNGSYRIKGKYGANNEEVDLSFKLDTNSTKTSVVGDNYTLTFPDKIIAGNSGVQNNWLSELKVNEALFDAKTGLDKIAAKTLAANIEMVYSSANRKNVQLNTSTKPIKTQTVNVAEGQSRVLSQIPQAAIAEGSYYNGSGAGAFSLEATEIKDGKVSKFKLTLDGVSKDIPSDDIAVSMDSNGNIRVQDKTVSPAIFDVTLKMNYGTDGKLTNKIGDKYNFVLPKANSVTATNAANANIPAAALVPIANYQGPLAGNVTIKVLEVDSTSQRPTKVSVQMGSGEIQTVPGGNLTLTKDTQGNYTIAGRLTSGQDINFALNLETTAGKASMVGDEYAFTLPGVAKLNIGNANNVNADIPAGTYTPTSEYAGPISGDIVLQVAEVDATSKRASKFKVTIGNSELTVPSEKLTLTKDNFGNMTLKGTYTENGVEKNLNLTLKLDPDATKANKIGDKYTVSTVAAGNMTVTNTVAATSPNMSKIAGSNYAGIGSGNIKLDVVETTGTPARPSKYKLTLPGQAGVEIPSADISVDMDVFGNLKIKGKDLAGNSLSLNLKLDADINKQSVVGDSYTITIDQTATTAATTSGNVDKPALNMENSTYMKLPNGKSQLTVLEVDSVTQRPTKFRLQLPDQEPVDIPNSSINVLFTPAGVDALNNPTEPSIRIIGRDAKNKEIDLKLSIDSDVSKKSEIGDVYTLDFPVATVTTAATVTMGVVTVDKYDGVVDNLNLEVTQVSSVTGRPAQFKLTIAGQNQLIPNDNVQVSVSADGKVNIKGRYATGKDLDITLQMGAGTSALADTYTVDFDELDTEVGVNPTTVPPAAILQTGSYYNGTSAGNIKLQVTEINPTTGRPSAYTIFQDGKKLDTDAYTIALDGNGNVKVASTSKNTQPFSFTINVAAGTSTVGDEYDFTLNKVTVEVENSRKQPEIPKGSLLAGSYYTGAGTGAFSLEVSELSLTTPQVPTKFNLKLDNGSTTVIPDANTSVTDNGDGTFTITDTATSTFSLILKMDRGVLGNLNSTLGDKYTFTLPKTSSVGAANAANANIPSATLDNGAYYAGATGGDIILNVVAVDAAVPARPTKFDLSIDGKVQTIPNDDVAVTINAVTGKYQIKSKDGKLDFAINIDIDPAKASAVLDTYRLQIPTVAVSQINTTSNATYDNLQVPNATVSKAHYQGNTTGEFKLEVSKVDTTGKPTAFELTVNGKKVASSDVTITIDQQSGKVKVTGSTYSFDVALDYTGGVKSDVGDNYSFKIMPSAKIDSMNYNSTTSRDFEVALTNKITMTDYNLANATDFQLAISNLVPEIIGPPQTPGTFDIAYSTDGGATTTTIAGTINNGVATAQIANPPSYTIDLNFEASSLSNGKEIKFSAENTLEGKTINQYQAKYTLDGGATYTDVAVTTVAGGTTAEDKIRLLGDNFDIVLDVPTDEQKLGDKYSFNVGAKTDIISLVDPLGYKYAGKVNTTYEITVLAVDTAGKPTKVQYSLDGGVTQKTATLDSKGNISMKGDLPFAYDISVAVNKAVKAGDNFVFEARPDSGGAAKLVNTTTTQYDSKTATKFQLKVSKLADEKGGIGEIEYTLDGTIWRRATVQYDATTGKSAVMLDSSDNLADGSTAPSIFNYKIELEIDANTANNKGDTYTFTMPQGNGSGDNAVRMSQFIKVGPRDASVTKDSANLGLSEYKTVIDKSISNFYEGQIGVLGIQSENAGDSADNTKILVDQMLGWRSEVSGVNLDEELALMIQFQKAYNASARMMTTMDEMLEKLINGTGTVGR